ncbi:methyltransferase domain-containing protein [Nocardioides panacihumi]|uniref:Methyltransferase domain-containing protein n=1 Tax=Nocardioides panacihumi TaxID=400774 RepID=A0ABN2R6C6_9ACTN
MTSFDAVESVWFERLGTLRNVVRQHVIREQLREHAAEVGTVLDVGCGQGTQAIALARRGHRVTGVDPSTDLLAQMGEQARVEGCTVEALQGRLEDLDAVVDDRTFDLVCAHGLLMYLPDAPVALAALVARTRPGGLLSFTFRNGDALAYRPGLRGQWQAALAAFDASRYVNELGAQAHAHRLDDVLGWCARLDLRIERWYGVRVLTDGRPADEPPDPETLADCLAAELEAGRRDPYRRLASQIHVIARR